MTTTHTTHTTHGDPIYEAVHSAQRAAEARLVGLAADPQDAEDGVLDREPTITEARIILADMALAANGATLFAESRGGSARYWAAEEAAKRLAGGDVWGYSLTSLGGLPGRVLSR